MLTDLNVMPANTPPQNSFEDYLTTELDEISDRLAQAYITVFKIMGAPFRIAVIHIPAALSTVVIHIPAALFTVKTTLQTSWSMFMDQPYDSILIEAFLGLLMIWVLPPLSLKVLGVLNPVAVSGVYTLKTRLTLLSIRGSRLIICTILDCVQWIALKMIPFLIIDQVQEAAQNQLRATMMKVSKTVNLAFINAEVCILRRQRQWLLQNELRTARRGSLIQSRGLAYLIQTQAQLLRAYHGRHALTQDLNFTIRLYLEKHNLPVLSSLSGSLPHRRNAEMAALQELRAARRQEERATPLHVVRNGDREYISDAEPAVNKALDKINRLLHSCAFYPQSPVVAEARAQYKEAKRVFEDCKRALRKAKNLEEKTPRRLQTIQRANRTELRIAEILLSSNSLTRERAQIQLKLARYELQAWKVIEGHIKRRIAQEKQLLDFSDSDRIGRLHTLQLRELRYFLRWEPAGQELTHEQIIRQLRNADVQTIMRRNVQQNYSAFAALQILERQEALDRVTRQNRRRQAIQMLQLRVLAPANASRDVSTNRERVQVVQTMADDCDRRLAALDRNIASLNLALEQARAQGTDTLELSDKALSLSRQRNDLQAYRAQVGSLRLSAQQELAAAQAAQTNLGLRYELDDLQRIRGTSPAPSQHSGISPRSSPRREFASEVGQLSSLDGFTPTNSERSSLDGSTPTNSERSSLDGSTPTNAELSS